MTNNETPRTIGDMISEDGEVAFAPLVVAGQTIEPTALPLQSIQALLRRGATHYFGNEISSKINGWKTKFLKDNKREPDDDEIDEQRQAFIDVALGNLYGGSVGLGRIASVTPREAVIDRVTRDEMRIILKSAKIPWPKSDDEVVQVVKTPEGEEARTLEDLLETWLEGHDRKGVFGLAHAANRPRIEQKADALLAERKAAAEARKARLMKAGEKVQSLSDLGF